MPDDELLKALTEAGLYPEQIRQLLPQLQMGKEWMQPQHAQGAHVGNTYVAASPLEHISNAIRSIVGHKMYSGALEKEKELTQGLGQKRQQYMQALQTAQSGGQGGSLGEPGGGMARPPDPGQADNLMMMGAGSGDSAIKNMSEFALHKMNYQRQLEMMKMMAGYREGMLHQGQERIDQNERRQLWRPDMWGIQEPHPEFAPPAQAGQGQSALPGALQATGGAPQAPPLDTSTPLKDATSADVNAKLGPQKKSGFGGFPQEYIDAKARQLKTEGKFDLPQMPAPGAAALSKKITERANEMYGPDIDFAKDKMKYASLKETHMKLTEQLHSVRSFTRTAIGNAEIMLKIAEQIPDTGVPLLNQPIRWAAQQLQGSPQQVAFNTAAQVAQTEFAKVLSGATMGVRVTDSQRHEIGQAFGPNGTLGQMKAVIETLKRDSANRDQSLADELKTIEDELSGKKPAEEKKPLSVDEVMKLYPAPAPQAPK